MQLCIYWTLPIRVGWLFLANSLLCLCRDAAFCTGSNCDASRLHGLSRNCFTTEELCIGIPCLCPALLVEMVHRDTTSRCLVKSQYSDSNLTIIGSFQELQSALIAVRTIFYDLSWETNRMPLMLFRGSYCASP
jgi:hypothetical protein